MPLILFIITGIINVLIANKKGFNPWIWFFAGGLLGLIVILILPSANKALPDNQQLYVQRRKTGNTAGVAILCFALLFIIVIVVHYSSI